MHKENTEYFCDIELHVIGTSTGMIVLCGDFSRMYEEFSETFGKERFTVTFDHMV